MDIFGRVKDKGGERELSSKLREHGYETGEVIKVYNIIGETAEDKAAFQLGQVIKSRGWNSRIYQKKIDVW